MQHCEIYHNIFVHGNVKGNVEGKAAGKVEDKDEGKLARSSPVVFHCIVK